MNGHKHTHTLICPNMCASTHILTSHQCIIIPKQTIINEPCDAYLSERRQPPPPLPLGRGCHSDRFVDIWRERRRGAGLKGWGCEVEGRGDGYRFQDVGALSFRCLFVFHLSISHPCQSVLSEGTVHELFSIKSLSGAILAAFHEGKD